MSVKTLWVLKEDDVRRIKQPAGAFPLLSIGMAAPLKLSIIGALQTALYALIVLAAGVLLYNESLTRVQVIGISMTVVGVILINVR